MVSIIIALSACCGSNNKENKPYETTWLELTKVDDGYVVYSYPHLWDDEATKSPVKIIVKNDTLTMIIFSDKPMSYKLEFSNIDNLGDSSYMFKVGNFYRFDYVDKTNHIAKWSIYYGDGDDRLMSDHLYIDSFHNTFPIIDFDWGPERPATGEAD